eukprot:m.231948 g.231948  ORF g.231948 m.231948 type:complete len:78 (+) comp16014_c0_seq4:2904-3137(+)
MFLRASSCAMISCSIFANVRTRATSPVNQFMSLRFSKIYIYSSCIDVLPSGKNLELMKCLGLLVLLGTVGARATGPV